MRISVAILTYNAGERFPKLLEVLRSQREVELAEIILLDSGSKDSTLAYAQEYAALVFSVDKQKFSFGSARQQVSAECGGDIIVHLSQDVVIPSELFLANLCAPLEAGEADITIGRENPKQSTFFWEREGMLHWTAEFPRFIEAYGGLGLSCVVMALRREIWEKTGFSNIEMCEDKLLQKRAYALQARMRRVDEAEVLHNHDYQLGSLFKRCANEGMGVAALGYPYRWGDVARDLSKRSLWGIYFHALLRGKLIQCSELIYPFLRPVALLFGRYRLKHYWR